MCYRESTGMTDQAMTWLIARLRQIEATAVTDQAQALAAIKQLRKGIEEARNRG